MRRLVPLVALLVAGCVSQPRAADTPLASGTLIRFVSYAGYESEAVYRGAQCTIFPEWVRIENEKEQLWVPRTSLSGIQIAPK